MIVVHDWKTPLSFLNLILKICAKVPKNEVPYKFGWGLMVEGWVLKVECWIHPPSIIHRPPSTIHRPPSTIHHPPSTVHHPPSTIHHPPSIIHHPSSIIHPLCWFIVTFDKFEKKAIWKFVVKEKYTTFALAIGNNTEDWWGGWVAETTSLLNWRTGNRTTSSNLVLTAKRETDIRFLFFVFVETSHCGVSIFCIYDLIMMVASL